MTDPDTDAPVEFPLPQVLEGTGTDELRDADLDAGPLPAEQARALARRLDETAEYGRTLWEQLRRIADYLREEVARGGAAGQPLPRSEEQWQRWRACYAQALTALAGPRGDEGYGEQEAEVELRRNRPGS